MNHQNFAFGIIVVSAVAGLVLGLQPSIELPDIQGSPGVDAPAETHEHALFYVVINGTEINLTSEAFQLNAREVHLENGRSHIVHKHRENVTWGDFLETLNMKLETGNTICLHIYEEEFCGNGSVVLNGEPFNPGKEIEQGDNFAIIIGNKSAEDYMEKELPPAYTPQVRGRSV